MTSVNVPSHISTLDRDGLWLIGVGALLVAVGIVVEGAPAGLGGIPVGIATVRQRLAWAATVVGAILVSVGSVLLAVDALPQGWFVVVVVVGSVSFGWVVLAWHRHRDARAVLDSLERFVGAGQTSETYAGWLRSDCGWPSCLKRPWRQLTSGDEGLKPPLADGG